MNEIIYYGDETGRHEAKGEILKQILTDREKAEADKAQAEAELVAKAEAKAALLERLGITADEAALLLS